VKRQRRVVSWMPLVRAAIPQCAEPFTSNDVCRVMGLDPYEYTTRQAVFDVLDRLTGHGELDKQTKKRGEKRASVAFTRTASFRAEAFDFAAQRKAAEFLQGLSIAWGNQRNQEHAAAE
jgi:hypothetical protein